MCMNLKKKLSPEELNNRWGRRAWMFIVTFLKGNDTLRILRSRKGREVSENIQAYFIRSVRRR